MITPPSLIEAPSDTTLPDVALRTLLVMVKEGCIDPHEWRPVKQEVISSLMRRKPQTVHWALQQLEIARYIRAGARDHHAPDFARAQRPTWYLLNWSRSTIEVRELWPATRGGDRSDT